METAKNVNQIIVATAAHTYGASETFASLTAGEIGIFTPNGVLIDGYANVTTGDKYVIAALGVSSGVLQVSDPIVKGKELVQAYNAYATSAAQIDYIGFNGTSGALEAINSNVYTVRLMLNDGTAASFAYDLIKEGFYKSDASALQTEVALGLVKSLVKNFSRETEQLILFERVNGGTSTATSAGAITFTKGSKYVSWPEDGNNNDAGKYNADGSSVAVGDFIRVGHATTLTYPVYRVAAITGAATTTIVLELDMEYQGASETVAAASCGIIPSVTAFTSSFSTSAFPVNSNEPSL